MGRDLLAEQDVGTDLLASEPQGTISKAPPWWMRDIVKPTMEYGGLTLGAAVPAIAGLAAPPAAAAAIPMAGAGYAAGKRGYEELETGIYGKQPDQEEVSAGRTLRDVRSGMTMEALGQGFGPTLGWLINKLPGIGTGIKSAFLKVNQIAKEEGIKLPLPAKTGSSTHAGVFKTASVMPTSEGTIAQEVSESLKQVEAFSQRTIKGKGLDITPKIVGDIAQTGESLAYQKVHEQGQNLYKSAVNLGRAKNVQVALTETNKTGQRIIESDEFSLLPGDLKESIKNIVQKTTSTTPEQASTVLNVQGKPISITPAKTEMVKRDLEQVDELRKALSSNAGHEEFYKDNVQRLFGQLGEALDKDVIRDTIKFKPVQDAWLKAREFQKQEIFGKFKGLTPEKQRAMGEKLLASDPSRILSNMDTVGGLNQVEKVLPGPYYDVARRGKIAESIKFKTIPVANGEVRIVDGEALRKTIYEGMAPEYRTKLFKPDELKALDRLIEVTRAFNRIEKLGGSQSGTPKGMWYGRLMTGEIVSMGAGYGVGGIPGMAVGITLSTLGPYGIAKFITSDAGKKFLIEGVKLGKMTRLTGTALSYAGMALSGNKRRQEREAIESGQSQEAVE